MTRQTLRSGNAKAIEIEIGIQMSAPLMIFIVNYGPKSLNGFLLLFPTKEPGIGLPFIAELFGGFNVQLHTVIVDGDEPFHLLVVCRIHQITVIIIIISNESIVWRESVSERVKVSVFQIFPYRMPKDVDAMTVGSG